MPSEREGDNKYCCLLLDLNVFYIINLLLDRLIDLSTCGSYRYILTKLTSVIWLAGSLGVVLSAALSGSVRYPHYASTLRTNK